jgi:uncharacterized delta-60 repeat protein
MSPRVSDERTAKLKLLVFTCLCATLVSCGGAALLSDEDDASAGAPDGSYASAYAEDPDAAGDSTLAQASGSDASATGSDASTGSEASTIDVSSDAAADGRADAQSPRDGASDAPGTAPPPCSGLEAGTSGSVDPSFANGTHAEVADPVDGDLDAQGNIYVLAHQSNCVGGASGGDLAIYKFAPSGQPDTSFGSNGRVCVSVGTTTTAAMGIERGYAIRVDPAGNVVVVGATGRSGQSGFVALQLVVARVTSAGQIDGTFATNGVYSTTVPGITQPIAYAVAFDQSVSPARVVVSGTDEPTLGGFVIRLTSTGQPDGAFNGGLPLIDLTAAAFWGVAVDSAGNVYVAGSQGGCSPAIVHKWSSSGLPDGSFGSAGKAIVPGGQCLQWEASSLFIDGSGRVVLGGMAQYGGAFVSRLTSTGTLDSAFAPGSPYLGTVPPHGIKSLGQRRSSLLRAGLDASAIVSGFIPGQFNNSFHYRDRMIVGRVSSAGAYEAFGSDGFACSSSELSYGLSALQDSISGKIVLIGHDKSNLVMERYLP